MRFFLLIFILTFYNYSISQKPFEPSSCYQMKSKMGGLSSASVIDDRGEYLDILTYTIDLDISDFVSKEISGNTQVHFKTLQTGQTSIDLDFLILDIDSIYFADSLITSYTYNDTLIHIDFPQELQVSHEYKVKVFYHGEPIQMSGDWGGFFWDSNYAYNIGVSFTEEIHNFGKAWFPCFDNFTERSTYNFKIKTKGNHKAFCNGTLNSTINNIDGTKTWVWNMIEEIPTYLASVAVSNYATVYDSYLSTTASVIPIQLAAKPGDTTNLKNSFIHLKDALASFENRFGKYRFSRVGYCVTSFTAGAMEHATNITYMKGVVNGTTQYETLMAHELAHHWWGDNTTCETAEDMWLNEGFASYSEAVFTESLYGAEAYKDYSRENHDKVLRRVHILDEGYLPVAGVPSDKTYSSTVYDKGADMIHTIRGILGEDVFFNALKEFQEIYEFSTINTEIFRAFISSKANLDLSSFFTTWIKQAGFHHFSISELEILEENDNYIIQGSLYQKLRETNIYTDFLPIEITFYDANWNKSVKTMYVYGECSDFQFTLDFNPIFWAVDIDEKIQDATVDKYETIKTVGIKDFGLARIELNVKSINDSSLVRVTHHFIKPDPLEDKSTNYHISPNRYWSFNGILSEGFETDGKFLFNGTTNNNSGYLDNDFILSSEENLVMLYRPDAKTDWSLVEDFEVNTQGSSTNKVGYITVYDLKKGDYVLAEEDESQTQDPATKTNCIYTSITNIDRLEKLIQIYPVPVNDYFSLKFLTTDMGIKKIKFHNVLGKEIDSFSPNKNQKLITISTKNWIKGVYFISFFNNENKNVYSKKIIIE